MEDVNKRRRFFFFLVLNLSAVSKKSTPGKFAYMWHFQRTGLNATKFEKTQILLKSGGFASVAVVDAEAPYKEALIEVQSILGWFLVWLVKLFVYNRPIITNACLYPFSLLFIGWRTVFKITIPDKSSWEGCATDLTVVHFNPQKGELSTYLMLGYYRNITRAICPTLGQGRGGRKKQPFQHFWRWL